MYDTVLSTVVPLDLVGITTVLGITIAWVRILFDKKTDQHHFS